MTYSVDNLFELRSDLNPIVGKFAKQLKSSLKSRPESLDRSSLRVVEQMLEFAVAAEQRLAEQSERISYLEALSITDELTGLLNRRGFSEVLSRTLANARRHDETGLLVYIDLDGFKDINDTYGHEAGDVVLRRAAEILRQNTRDTDYVARLGGDEFAALLVRGDRTKAHIRLLYLSDLLNASEVEFQGRMLPVRGSVGVAPYGPNTNEADLLRDADAAMYRSKRANQDASASPKPSKFELNAGHAAA